MPNDKSDQLLIKVVQLHHDLRAQSFHAQSNAQYFFFFL